MVSQNKKLQSSKRIFFKKKIERIRAFITFQKWQFYSDWKEKVFDLTSFDFFVQIKLKMLSKSVRYSHAHTSEGWWQRSTQGTPRRTKWLSK